MSELSPSTRNCPPMYSSVLVSLSRSLSCQRITLHKNLFFSFVCNSVVTIISLTAVANNQELVATNPVSESVFGRVCLLGGEWLRECCSRGGSAQLMECSVQQMAHSAWHAALSRLWNRKSGTELTGCLFPAPQNASALKQLQESQF